MFDVLEKITDFAQFARFEMSRSVRKYCLVLLCKYTSNIDTFKDNLSLNTFRDHFDTARVKRSLLL